MELNEIIFIRGFNNGYILAEFEPNLIKLLLNKFDTSNIYCKGLILGQQEYELDITSCKINELKNIRRKKENDRDR